MATAGNNNNRVVFAWSMYDFANSAFTTLVVTFIYSTYFVKAIAPDVITGTVLWSRAVTITGLTVALLSPILGALADRGGAPKTVPGNRHGDLCCGHHRTVHGVARSDHAGAGLVRHRQHRL